MTPRKTPTFKDIVKRPGMKRRLFLLYCIGFCVFGLSFGLGQAYFTTIPGPFWQVALITGSMFGAVMGLMNPLSELWAIQKKERGALKTPHQAP